MFHPFYVKNEDGTGRWKAASNLEAGDELLTDDGSKVSVSEIKVEKLDNEVTVYNLELGDVHTYFVAGGVLVHNYCTPQEMNKMKEEALEGKDIQFKKKDDALEFIAIKFPGFNEETAGHRGAEGWHFDKHPIGDSIDDVVHINLYSKKFSFRIHITWLD